METEFAAMLKPFEVPRSPLLLIVFRTQNPYLDSQGKETEQNWEAREQAVLRVRGMLKGDAHLRYADTFLACLKEGFIQWSLKAVSEKILTSLNCQ
jgi:CLIP-associating protein 1/2